MTILLTGCSKEEVPKCSDDRTTTLVRKIIIDQIERCNSEGLNEIGGSKGLSEKEIQENIKIEFPRASGFDEKIKKYSCDAKLITGGSYQFPITYESQLDDKGQHIVAVVGLHNEDLWVARPGLIENVKKSRASQATEQKIPTPVPAVEESKPSNISTSDSIPIEGIRIGMSTKDISNLFPSLDLKWLNDDYIDNKTGKKRLKSLDLFSRDVPRLSRDGIESLDLEFDENDKVNVIRMHYENSSLNNLNVFKKFMFQRYGLKGNWTVPKKAEYYCCSELIVSNYKYIIISGANGDHIDYPLLRVELIAAVATKPVVPSISKKVEEGAPAPPKSSGYVMGVQGGFRLLAYSNAIDQLAKQICTKTSEMFDSKNRGSVYSCYENEWQGWVKQAFNKMTKRFEKSIGLDMGTMSQATKVLEYPDGSKRLVFGACRQHFCDEARVYVLVDPKGRDMDIIWQSGARIEYIGQNSGNLKKGKIYDLLNDNWPYS